MKRRMIAITAMLAVLLGGCSFFQTDQAEFIAGTVKSGVYTSDFAGFVYTPPAGWVIADRDKAMEKLSLPEENFTKQGETYKKYTTLCDLYAMPDPVNGSSVYILLDNMASYRDDRNMTEDQYLEMLVRPQVKAEESQVDYGEPFDVVLAGQTYRAIESEIAGKGLWQRYYARRINGCMFVIVTMDITQPNQEAFAACFSLT